MTGSPGSPGSLDGLRFAPVADQRPGQVGTGTAFHYREADGVVWADYSGGDITRGHLIGTRSGNEIDFRYVQLKRDGDTASGHCHSVITKLADGRLRLGETWAWESEDGYGTSIVEQIA